MPFSSSYAQFYAPSGYGSSTIVNFVRTWEAKRPLTTPSAITSNSNVAEVSQTTEFFDGIGRPLQTVSKQTSPIQADMVNVRVFDPQNRETYSFLPFESNIANVGDVMADGKFKFNAFEQQKNFYDVQLAGQSDSFFYALNRFEQSPLNRVLESYGPGKHFAGSENKVGEENRHGLDLHYGFNTSSDNVLRWTVTDGTPGTFGTYAASSYVNGALTKMITEDEHGGQVLEFKDKEGNIVLRKVLLTASIDLGGGSNGHDGWINTYYIYDDQNRLRCVVQPDGERLMWIVGVGAVLSTAILNEQCFRYEYDARGRMIMKKVPGANVEEMVYDTRDRLIMARHGNLAAQGYWLVNRYDNLNRLIVNALSVNALSRAANQAYSDANINYPTVGSGDTMQVNYYDNYGWINGQANISATLATEDFNSAFFYVTYNTAPQYAQAIIPDYVNVRGKPTGSKVRVLGTNTYLNSVVFYDDNGRVIQIQKANISGSYDRFTTQYDFAGRVLRYLHRQSKAAPVGRFTRELTKYTYDHAGRVTLVTKKVGLTGADKVMAANEYSERCLLKSTTVGNNLETQNYEYNVRGWLLGVNRNYIKNTATNYFGYELGYDNNQTIMPFSTYAHPQFNGNVGGTVWKSAGDSEIRSYDFTYDKANRITAADFNQVTNGSFNRQAGLDFSVSGLAYDVNGNILTMNQQGFKATASSPIDFLTYTYQSGSNKLAKVVDTVTAPNSKLGDFKDGVNTGDDYAYDVNGNLTLDNNKSITSILYTHLNMPYEINIAGKGKITYAYDNLGNKLKKVVIDNTTSTPKTTTWLYMDNFVYKNDTLQFFTTEAGRARYDTAQAPPEATNFDFDYFLKDHLGNVRMVLTEEKDTGRYDILSFEGLTGSAEQQNQDRIWENKTGASINIATARTARPGAFGTAVSNGSYAMLVRKSTGAIGAAKLLKVMTGDRIHTSVDYYYTAVNANNTGAGGITSLVANLATSILSSGQVAGALKDGAAGIASSLGSNTGLVNWLNAPNTTSGANNAPKAYLNIVFFDEQFRPDNTATVVVPVPYGPNAKGTIDRTFTNAVAAKKNGYVYVYFSNESDELVYFDNFMLTHEKGPVMGETHYYPFGLTMAAISSNALGKTENKYKYNKGSELQNKEFSDGSGLELYDTHFRQLDPQLGRWWQIDPKANESESPYASMSNNPIRFNDPLGDTIIDAQIKGDKNWGKAYNKWLDSKAGKAFVKQYSPGGKYGTTTVTFKVGKTNSDNSAQGNTKVYDVDRKTGASTELHAGQTYDGIDKVAQGKSATNYLKFDITFRDGEENNTTERQMEGADGIIHETQHVRIDQQTLSTNSRIAPIAGQHSDWMKPTSSTWYQERAGFYIENRQMWNADYERQKAQGKVRNESEYIKSKVNDFIN